MTGYFETVPLVSQRNRYLQGDLLEDGSRGPAHFVGVEYCDENNQLISFAEYDRRRTETVTHYYDDTGTPITEDQYNALNKPFWKVF